MNYRIYSLPELNPTHVILEVENKTVRRVYATSSFERSTLAWWWNFRIRMGWNPLKDMYSGKIK